MTVPTARPSTPSGLSQAYETKATDHELQKYDNFTRYGQSAMNSGYSRTYKSLGVDLIGVRLEKVPQVAFRPVRTAFHKGLAVNDSFERGFCKG